MKKTVSFLVSGRGSNFQAVASAIIKGDIPATVGIVISDKPGVKALDIARELSIPAFFVNPKDYATRQDHEKAMIDLLQKCNTDLVVTAGYMRLLTPFFVNEFKNRIINIHPALLPSFPGTHAQKQALEYGVKISGCTTHFIDEGTDSGPIILQKAVPVYDDDTEDTLSARILKEEHQILIESVKLYCMDKLKVKGRKVFIVR
ncbi:MAG TPA: phosphoribosylglycinamide formyltransferase [Spirochaetota bacterium]|nr:phosphoribosylglycinamide formyltransferase [Spirochaetota bacterium]